ncbi:glycosyltransferase family 4 protein [Desulfobacter curvatus]|uniref:glycosyltransferase family 4 protein n=1 Tax=Desulfobacter curvatus TaxID=2290 RepID=UPI000372F22E|nr:glycosyltransferase family 4 protein [Desulfobacter curvatus]
MIREKKIILVTYGNFPYGGASANLLRYFSIGLMKLGNNIEVIMPTGNCYGRDIDHNKHKQGVVDGVKYKHLGFVNHPRKAIGKIIENFWGITLPFLYLLSERIKKEVDIVVCYNATWFRFLMLLIIKKIMRKKLVVILPEFYEKPVAKFFSIASLKWFSFYFSMKYLIRYADGFIVLSYYLKNFVENKLGEKKPVIVMPNLIDPERFKKSNIKPFLRDKITIGYIGTPTRKDGVVDLIKSFSLLNKKYPDTHLLIIGDVTNGTILPQLRKLANELAVSDCITFTGLISHENVPELLYSSQILALTRPRGVFAEAGFPTKLGEYFACQKPVVITDVGDIPRYFTNEVHLILVEAENVDSITNGFEKLLLEPNLREEISKNSYAWMNNHLNFNHAVKKIDHFMNRVLEL